MPAPPRTSVSGVSANNIIEGSRKRAKLDLDFSSAAANSPASSTSRLLDGSSSNAAGPEAEEATQLGFKLLDVLINRIDEDETPISVPFLALPLRSDYPDYYNLIKNPISLEQIRRRLQSRSYKSLEEVRNNMETICRNAKRYNQKGSEIYEKARTLHQIILHAFVDLVEKGDVQPITGLVMKSDPPLQQQSERLAKIEQPNRKARLDYDELDNEDVVGRVSLRLKKDDDIPYDEDEDEAKGKGEGDDEDADANRQEEEEGDKDDDDGDDFEESAENGSVAPIGQQMTQVAETKIERSTPQIEGSVVNYDREVSSARMSFDRDLDMEDVSGLDRSMLTLGGKFDRRKRPGPRGKRLKSTLRTLVSELKAVLNQSGQPITRFFLSLPSRLQYPDYYKVIQRPVALDSIEGKVSRKDYVNPHALVADLRQMVENAQYYNEEGSEVWEAAEEIRQYVEGTTIPTLLADGFTLDPNDLRQSALPVEIAANSTVPAQAAAFRIQVERRRALENGTSTEMIDSVSPELKAKALPPSGEHSFKVRLNNRAHTTASPAAPSEMPPPGMAPPNAALGLPTNDLRYATQGVRLPSQGLYGHPTMNSPGNLSSSYLNTNLPPSAVNGSHWQAGKANGIQAQPALNSQNPYFAATPPNLSGQSSLQGGTSYAAPSMLPPIGAPYLNGSLPYQKPAQSLSGNQIGSEVLASHATDGNTIQRTTSNSSKRLAGEGPVFDPFKTNILQVDSETTIIRNAVISQFNIVMQSDDDHRKNLKYRLMNDVTRIHSINLASGALEQWKCIVEMTPRDMILRDPSSNSEESRQWTVSIHHNGKGIRPQGSIDEIKSSNGSIDVSAPATTTTSRVQIEAGTSCHFQFSPNPGANIISIHIHPPPPNLALQEIIKDDKNPLRSKAKALQDLPERYRILVYCRS